MKRTVVLLALCFALALSQTIPATTNPDAYTYFSPAVVQNMTVNSVVTGTIYNTTDNVYNVYYKLWIPSYVGGLRFILNNTASSNYVDLEVNFFEGHEDTTLGFPCSGSSGADSSFMCYGHDNYLEASSNSYTTGTYDLDDFLPGHWAYITINQYYNYDEPTTYALSAETTFQCLDNETLAVDSSSTYACVPNTDVANVTSNGAAFSSDLLAVGDFAYYKVDVPQNVTRAWAWVVANVSNLNLYVSEGYAARTTSYSWDYASSGSYNSTTATYNYFVQIEYPADHTPVYFVVEAFSASSAYSIQILWSACGSSWAGLGVLTEVSSTANSTFTVPDCSEPVQHNDINITSLATVNFALPAYNSSLDNNYAGAFGFYHIPVGTVGSINITCNSTTDGTFVNFVKGQLADCNNNAFQIACTGPNDISTGFVYFLSEDLYPGGYWSVAACSRNTSDSTVSLVSNGYFAVPSPSVTPTPSVTPSMTPSSSSTPSSTPSISSSPEPDSSTSVIVPAIFMIVMAALVTVF